MRSFFVTAFAVTVGFAIHCGGRVDGNPDGGSCNAGDLCSTDGAQCSFETTYCNQPTTETCTCQNGQWACPIMAGNCPIEGCPMDTSPGMSCSTKGLQCESMMKPECVDTPIMCTCDGQQFECPIPDCPVPVCPPPDQVVEGASCNVPGNEACDDVNHIQCWCMSTWHCGEGVDAGPPLPIDAGGTD
jgi:hypothetical protein